MTCAIDCLSAAALRRTTLWLSAGLAVLVLAAAASLTLSAPPPAAPQAGPPAPQASQAGPSAPQTSQGGPSRPEPLQTPASSETTPPAQAPPSAPPAIAGGAGVEFRLANADLLQFINLVAGELKLNYVLDPAVKGSVTINTAGKLNPGDLLPILETVLEINGATAVASGNFYRIVPMKEALKIPLPVLRDTSGKDLPPDDRMVMEIVPLRFVPAADMSKMLSPFLSDGGAMTVHESGNVLILVDNSLNVKRLMEIHARYHESVVALEQVDPAKAGLYGIVGGRPMNDGLYLIEDLIEKPKPGEAPTNLAIAARYAFTPDIFDYLAKMTPGKNGEIQLTDAMRLMLKDRAIYGLKFDGRRFDIGNKLDFLKTNVEFGLAHPDLGADFRQFIKRIASKL